MIGTVDSQSIELGKAVGIDAAGGSINKIDGRVRLFVKGKFPGAHAKGYALRSRVIWWLNTGEVLRGMEANLHHRNHDRADDSFANLEKMEHRSHAIAHNAKTVEMVERRCLTCGSTFKIERWRLRDVSRGQYCSQACYHAAPKEKSRVALSCEECGRTFSVVPNRAAVRRFCSRHCSAVNTWRQRKGEAA